MKAEQIVINQIQEAFPNRKRVNDAWIVENPRFLETTDVEEAKQYLPAIMTYVLRHLRTESYSVVYMNLLDMITQYSKCKNQGDGHEGLKHSLSPSENKAVVAFIKHIRYNQPSNIDVEQLDKILGRWSEKGSGAKPQT